MLSFIFSGMAFLGYAKFKFKDKIFYPSVIFSLMWGFCSLYTGIILAGFGENLYLKSYYTFKYMDEYIIYFTLVTLLGFYLSHKFGGRNGISLGFSLDFIDRILGRYKFIMWLCFFGGILRIFLMVNLVGFDVDRIIDYRVAANNMMMASGTGFVPLVFKITAYIQMLANFYVALYGFRVGFSVFDLKRSVILFSLYSPIQLATGGRLIIFYFIIFYFGSFLLGRGLAYNYTESSWLLSKEKKALILIFGFLLSLVAFIGMFRGNSTSASSKKENFVEKFAYITEGVLCAEKLMCKYPPGTYQCDYGVTTFVTTYTPKYLAFRRQLNGTKMSAVIGCVIVPLYLDFGYWGSLLVWLILVVVMENLSLKCLANFTLVNFLVFLVLLKVSYETILTNSIQANLPTYELLLIFGILYKPIFGRFE